MGVQISFSFDVMEGLQISYSFGTMEGLDVSTSQLQGGEFISTFSAWFYAPGAELVIRVDGSARFC